MKRVKFNDYIIINIKNFYIPMILVFILSRFIFYLQGIRPDPIPIYLMQVLDLNLLKTNLLESLFYLHSQPPLYNFLIGMFLKAFSKNITLPLWIFYMLLNISSYFLLFKLLCYFKINPLLSFIISTVFIIGPSCILWENTFFYTSIMFFLVLSATFFLYKFLSFKTYKYAITFFSILACIVLTRSIFQIYWMLLIIIVLFIILKQHRRIVLLSSLIPFIIVFSLFLKNYIIFGTFTSSSWIGMSLNKIAINNIHEDQIKDLIRQNKLTKLALITSFSPIEDYNDFLPTMKKTGIKALDDTIKPTCPFKLYDRNFNNINYLSISKLYIKEAIVLLKTFPANYFTSIRSGLFIFFCPSSEYPLLRNNCSKIKTYHSIYNILIFGQFCNLGDCGELYNKKTSSIFNLLLSFKYTGLTTILFFLILICFTLRFVISLIHKRNNFIELSFNQKIVFLFMIFNTIYITIVVNCLEINENQRMRYNIEPLLIISFGIIINNWIQKYKRTKNY